MYPKLEGIEGERISAQEPVRRGGKVGNLEVPDNL
jgi:hypothetical protein